MPFSNKVTQSGRYRVVFALGCLAAWMVFGLRMMHYAPFLLPDQDEAHYAVVGYHLWKRWSERRQFYQRFLRAETQALANTYLLLPTHFPLGYVIHGLPQVIGPGGWRLGRYWSIAWAMVMAGGLGLLLWRLWGPRWCFLGLSLLAFTHGWVTFYPLIVAQTPALALGVWGLLFLSYPHPWRIFVGSALFTLSAYVRAEMWPAVFVLLIYYGWRYQRHALRKHIYLALGSGLFLPSIGIHLLFWPLILYPWKTYLSLFLPLQVSVPTWHFRTVGFTIASRLLAFSQWGQQTPLAFWTWMLMLGWLVGGTWRSRRTVALPPVLGTVAGAYFFLGMWFIYFTFRGAAPYHSYWFLFSPLALLLLPWLWNKAQTASFWHTMGALPVFLVWTWMVGYALSPDALFIPHVPGYRPFFRFVKPYLPQEILIAYDLPPLRVYQGLFLSFGILLTWIFLWVFVSRQKRWRWSGLQLMLMVVMAFHILPFNRTMENLCKPPLHTFALQKTRTQVLTQVLAQTLGPPPYNVLVHQDPLLALGFRGQFRLAGETLSTIDEWTKQVQVFIQKEPPQSLGPFWKFALPSLTCAPAQQPTLVWIRIKHKLQDSLATYDRDDKHQP